MITGDFIAGFTEGEGCFALTLRRDVRRERPGSPVYYSWKISFVIVLRADDSMLLEKIKEHLRCGRISFTKNNSSVRYEVSLLEDLNSKIVPFFEHHYLCGKKKNVFLLWKEAVEILLKYKNQQKIVEMGKRGFIKTDWDQKDIEKMLILHKKMIPYKSKHSAIKWGNMPLGRDRNIK